jgi:hypothetical protein
MGRIKRAANFFLLMFFLVLFYAIIQAVALIKSQQFTFMTFLQLAFMLIPYIIMWGFADATYEALNAKQNVVLTKEEREVLDNYTDHR